MCRLKDLKDHPQFFCAKKLKMTMNWFCKLTRSIQSARWVSNNADRSKKRQCSCCRKSETLECFLGRGHNKKMLISTWNISRSLELSRFERFLLLMPLKLSKIWERLQKYHQKGLNQSFVVLLAVRHNTNIPDKLHDYHTIKSGLTDS